MRDNTNSGFIAACFILCLLGVFGILGIIVEHSRFLDKPGSSIIPSERKDKEIVSAKSKLGLFFLAFSFTRNIKKIMSIGGGGPGYDANLEVFAAVRAFSMMYIILGHFGDFQA